MNCSALSFYVEKRLKKLAKKFAGKEKRRTFAIPFGNGGTSRAARHTEIPGGRH